MIRFEISVNYTKYTKSLFSFHTQQRFIILASKTYHAYPFLNHIYNEYPDPRKSVSTLLISESTIIIINIMGIYKP